MSKRAKVAFERGKFFIETGTAKTFASWVARSLDRNFVRGMPEAVIYRIGNLINQNNRDDAVTLWMHACRSADVQPMKRKLSMVVGGYLVVVGFMATYAFVRTLFG